MQIIKHQSLAQFIAFLEDDQNQISEDELTSFILSSRHRQKKTAAFLRLIKTADLALLKELNEYVGLGCNVDVGYPTPIGVEAIINACQHGRIDVLKWLVNDLHFSVNPNHKNSDYIIFAAVRFGQMELLRELIKPTDEGGFGLSADIRDRLDYGLAMHAANAGSFDVFAEIIKPVSQGGLGLHYSTPYELVNFPYDFPNEYPDRQRYVMTIQHSHIAPSGVETLTVLDMENASTESYKLGKILGSGSYGSVHEFICNGKKIAVKVPDYSWEECDISWLRMEMKNARREFNMLCRAYPDEGPYALQSMRKIKDGEYYCSWRMMMPFIPGKRIDEVLKTLTDPLLIAKIILKTAEALQQVHERDVIHGDIRIGNVLVDLRPDQEISVHLIDFGFAYRASKLATAVQHDEYEFFAPERIDKRVRANPSQDVWSLARTMEWSLSNYQLRCLNDFPTIKNFIKDGLQENPLLRPTLPAFIDELKLEIAAYEDQQEKESRLYDFRKRPNYVRANRFFVEDKNQKRAKEDSGEFSLELSRGLRW